MARGPFVKEEEVKTWHDQAKSGVSIAEIAKNANRNINTVRRYLSKPAANDEPKAPEAA